ncbi:hypothetical protein [Anaeromyxobacter oryzae]|uniref:DUF2764 family protein n=1 Tax=Anaeromyxobacter oryzae TaxID=2918170 RepID=A0ABM7WPS1_9BACT|nr:hypothetical protein [Anaeromyxobacter oryzae]BDG01457.1 hypothetical protein AMOR_04530 [Anaeromyxobacter oryzae]
MRWPWRRYHMLISSLPALPTRFDAERLPISAERLQDRLRMLDPEDGREIRHLLEILEWTQRFAETTDAAVVARYRELMRGISHPLLREAAARAVAARMIATALRRRRRGLGPPAIGIGGWVDHIRRHFGEPDLGLAHAFPRVPELRRLFDEGDALGFHRGLIDATWVWLKRRADDHHFTFEAVALYVGRWELMHHWQQLEAGRGRAVFETLVAEALGEHADVYA